MKYQSIDDYKRKWIFTHASMPLDADALAQIKPFTQAQSAQFWKENISKESPDMERLNRNDWPSNLENWSSEEEWMKAWESDNEEMPDALLMHVDWQDDVTVYFCYEKYNVVETSWKTFKRHWKNFLFYDDGPILIARRRKQALWFQDNGKVKLGARP
jgi:hypothetical protein